MYLLYTFYSSIHCITGVTGRTCLLPPARSRGRCLLKARFAVLNDACRPLMPAFGLDLRTLDVAGRATPTADGRDTTLMVFIAILRGAAQRFRHGRGIPKDEQRFARRRCLLPSPWNSYRTPPCPGYYSCIPQYYLHLQCYTACCCSASDYYHAALHCMRA